MPAAWCLVRVLQTLSLPSISTAVCAGVDIYHLPTCREHWPLRHTAGARRLTSQLDLEPLKRSERLSALLPCCVPLPKHAPLAPGELPWLALIQWRGGGRVR